MPMIVRACTARAGTRRTQFADASGVSSGASKLFAAALFSAALCTLHPVQAQYVQQGPKLVGSGPVGGAEEGSAAALSADGNTAIVGGRFDNSNIGALWVFARSGGVWTQQGPKLVGTGAVGPASQGFQLAISADGNTAITSGYTDNMGAGARLGLHPGQRRLGPAGAEALRHWGCERRLPRYRRRAIRRWQYGDRGLAKRR